jgi:hypothetical protein
MLFSSGDYSMIILGNFSIETTWGTILILATATSLMEWLLAIYKRYLTCRDTAEFVIPIKNLQ